jgi:Spy/CpxP family protein refolding chaperone
MKKHIKLLVLTAIMAISAVAHADSTDPIAKNQQKATPEQRIEKRIERMKKNLNISDEQVFEIRTLLTGKKNLMQEHISKMKSAQPADKATLRNELKSAKLSTQNEILRILTPEQRIKAESLRDAKKQQHKAKRKQMR